MTHMRERFTPPQFSGSGQFPTDGIWIHDGFMLAMTIVVVVATVWIIRMVMHRPQHCHPVTGAALQELDLRYARGELKRDDYLQRRQDLAQMGGGHEPHVDTSQKS